MTPKRPTYDEFLRHKVQFDKSCGVTIEDSDINPLLKPHQRDIVRWAVHKGRAGIFAAFGLGKTFIQLEAIRLVITKTGGGNGLIVAPLGVRQEFKRDAEKLGLEIRFIRRDEEVIEGADLLYITNYESIRDGKLDPRKFKVVSLDEASILRGFGGTKTFRKMMQLFEGSGLYRFVATATPSPNEYIELLAYSAFLDVMDVGQAKTRFFKRNSEKADELTLHPHKEREFWLWVSSWAIFLQRPSDLGYSDEGYELPPMEVHWHEVASDHTDAGQEPGGQARLLRNSAISLPAAAKEKRDSLPQRIAKLMELREIDPSAHRVIWHDLESEREAIEAAIENVATVYGSQDLDEREKIIIDFSDGVIPELATKPVIAGSGCNFQRHCAWEIFLGIGFKFNDCIQAIHRVSRFLQDKPVRIDFIYTEAEREIKRVLEEKWERHKELTAQMTAIIREYGLARNAIDSELQRSLGVKRQEVSADNWRAICNDSILELPRHEENSVALVLTSIPFSTQYEYTPSYHDFGHTDSNEHFWQQMDYLTPELFRVLQPGRVAAIHVKDRIVPSGLTGMGFQTVYPFSDDCIRHFQKHGFGFLARKTIVTDVVRENNQTYRLGWTEQCKDGSRMGAGMPEYLLLFRKPPTDTSNGYADLPVVKEKADYSRSRWQIDAHGFMRSSGDRLLGPEDLVGLPHDRIFRLYRSHSLSEPYDFEQHVRLSESLETCSQCGHIHIGQKCCGSGDCECKVQGGRLPTTFMLLQPQSWHPDVWTDIARMRTMNTLQAAANREMHLCPLQFDIVNRVISQFTMEGETILDPFGGLMTVPYCAVKLGRKGVGIELSQNYWADGVAYLRSLERQVEMPTLFDLVAR
jgi:hypothetical protein